MHHILDPAVGSMTGIEVGRVDAETLAWAGVDATGSLRAGTVRLRVDLDDGKSTKLAWGVDVEGESSRAWASVPSELAREGRAAADSSTSSAPANRPPRCPAA